MPGINFSSRTVAAVPKIAFCWQWPCKSTRSQVEDLAGVKALHPLEIIERQAVG